MKITLTGTTSGGAKRIQGIKAIRTLTDYGLKEAMLAFDTLSPAKSWNDPQSITIDARIDDVLEIQKVLDEGSLTYDLKVPTSLKIKRAVRKLRAPRLVRRFFAKLPPFGMSIPFYVTRKNADGYIGTWSIGAYFGVLITLLLIFNVIGWSSFTLYLLILKVV